MGDNSGMNLRWREKGCVVCLRRFQRRGFSRLYPCISHPWFSLEGGREAREATALSNGECVVEVIADVSRWCNHTDIACAFIEPPYGR